jgi:hypothetical protein
MSLSSIYRPNEDISNPSLDSVLAKLAVMSTDQLKAFAAQNQDDMIMLGAAQAVHAKREEYAQKANAQQGGSMPPVNQQVVQNMDPVPQMPQGMPQGMPPQGMPPQGMPPQGMPPQGGQGMPPQGMPPQGGGPLPEQQGIAQLPTPNIDNMAGGGIVAFADGGSADEDTMYSGEPVMRMADGGHIPRYQGVPTAMGGDGSLVRLPNESFADYRRRTFEAVLQEQRDRNTAEEKAREAERQRVLGARGENTIVPPSPFFERAPLALNATQTAGTTLATTVPSQRDDNFRRQPDPRIAGTAATSPSVPLITSDSVSASAPAPGTKPAAPGTKPAAPADGKAPEGLEALTARFTRESDLAQGALKNQRVGLSSLLEKEATDEAAAVKKRIKDEGDVFAGKEARLAEREKGLTGMKDENLGLALLQAGAAMMSTPGSLGTAVGIGVQVGSKSYIAGMDKINAAKEKFAEARERMEDLRLNRKDMNDREIRDADRAIRNSRIQGQQLMLDGATNDLKISTDNQRAIFTTAADAIQTDKKLASAESIAATGERGANARSAAQIAATLNTPDRILFDQLLARNNNDAVKALEAFKLAKGDKFDVRTSYADYLKAFAGKEGVTPPMSMGAYAGQFGATLPR